MRHDDLSFAGKTVIVTGGNGGIGQGIVQVFSERDANVVIADIGDPLEPFGSLGAGRILDVRTDITDRASVDALVARTLGEFGRIDVLVNNAGYGLIGPVEDMTATQFRAQLETNVVGLAEVTRAFLPMMRAQRSGRIINISSMGGRTTFPVFAPYHASKFAVEGLTEAMQYELKPFGIDVVLVEPGAFGTDFDGGSMVRALAPASPYTPILANMDARMKTFRFLAQNPKRVGRAIARAATARRPRLRYTVGIDATVFLAIRPFVPWRVRHWINARMIGIPFRLP